MTLSRACSGKSTEASLGGLEGVTKKGGKEELRSQEWGGHRLCRTLLDAVKTLAFCLCEPGSA